MQKLLRQLGFTIMEDAEGFFGEMRRKTLLDLQSKHVLEFSFRKLGDFVRDAALGAQIPDVVRKWVEAFRDALAKERQQLIEQKLGLMELYRVLMPKRR